MTRKLSTLLLLFLGLLHTSTITSDTSTAPTAYVHTSAAAVKDGADLVEVSHLDPLGEILESVKIFLLGLGSLVSYVSIHNWLVMKLNKQYFGDKVVSRLGYLSKSAKRLADLDRTIRLAILCGIGFGVYLGILFGVGLFTLARIYPKRSTYPPLTSLDILKGVTAWFSSVLLTCMGIAGVFYLLIDDRNTIIDVVQTAGYLIGIVATLLLYYYLYRKRAMLRKKLIQPQQEESKSIEGEQQVPRQ